MSRRRRPSARILTPTGWAGVLALVGFSGVLGLALMILLAPR